MPAILHIKRNLKDELNMKTFSNLYFFISLARLNEPIIQTIAGSLDTVVNPSMRAPDWIQKRGLEWLFRLIKQPFRFRRQLTLLNFII